MPVLLSQRPFVVFDAKKKEHRAWFSEFVKTGSWAGCPVRFYVPEDVGMDQVTMIRIQLINYYIEKEFGIVDKQSEKFVKDHLTV